MKSCSLADAGSEQVIVSMTTTASSIDGEGAWLVLPMTRPSVSSSYGWQVIRTSTATISDEIKTAIETARKSD